MCTSYWNEIVHVNCIKRNIRLDESLEGIDTNVTTFYLIRINEIDQRRNSKLSDCIVLFGGGGGSKLEFKQFQLEFHSHSPNRYVDQQNETKFFCSIKTFISFSLVGVRYPVAEGYLDHHHRWGQRHKHIKNHLIDFIGKGKKSN